LASVDDIMGTGRLVSSLGDAIADATAKLSAAGVDAPKLVAQVLMAHALGVLRANVVMSPPTQPLQPHQFNAYRAFVARCAEGEPMAYVIGTADFYGLEFAVDRRALIPRPETEHLVEMAQARIKADPASSPLRQTSSLKAPVVDVGTGSGCIAISLAVKLPEARLIATDISSDALALATENARRHKVSARIQFLRGDLLAPLPVRAEGIVANLPYVTTAEWERLARNIRNYEPRAALDGGPDGLTYIRRLLSQAAQRVKPDGWLLLEIGATQGQAVTALARRTFPLAAINLHRDYAGLTRIVEIQLRAVPGVKL
jgi:release factor glutamine methyltransferase